MRARVAVLPLLGSALLVASGLLALSPVGAASASVAATVTATSVNVQPGGVLETYTPTTFVASVTPASAEGSVVFTFDSQQIGSGPVTGGQAAFSTNTLKPGTWALRAQFVPAPGSGFAPSVSVPVTVTVNDIPRLFLSYTGGAAIPVGGQVKVGAEVTIAASGWPGNTIVNLAIGTLSLPTKITTNKSGSGSVDIVVPTSLPSAVYLLSGLGGQRSTSFVFYVYNPPPSTPTPQATATVPVSSSGGGTGQGSVITVTPAPVTVTPTPYTTTVAAAPSNGDGLASTGGDPLPLVAGAVLALGLGSGLVGAAKPVAAGRHERPRRLQPSRHRA